MPTFSELSLEMNPDERKELLAKIQASLNLSTPDSESIVSKKEEAGSLRHRLTEEISRLGFWDRFFLKLAAFFSGRDVLQAFQDGKLARTKGVLRERIPELVSFHRQEWTPEFGRLLYDLYVEASALRPVFDHLFGQKITLEAGLIRLIEDEHRAIHELEDLFPSEEIANAYQKDPRASALLSLLDQRLEAHWKSIPAEVFDRVNLRMLPLYFLRPLVQFPYGALFDTFGHRTEGLEPRPYPLLQGASWKKVSSLFERLSYGLFVTTKVEPWEGGPRHIFEEFVHRWNDEKSPWTVESLGQRLESLWRFSQEMTRRVPWKEVLQWSFQDPFYEVRYVLPQFSVRDFYQNTILMKLRAQLVEALPHIRRHCLSQETAALFEGHSLPPLEFYLSGMEGQQSGQGFRHPESLSVLGGFLLVLFPQKVVPFYQSLSRLVPQASRNALQSLTRSMDEVSALKQRFQQFDRSLHPSTDEGREYFRLKADLGTKPITLKPFLEMLQHKDAQAAELLEVSLEKLPSLLHHFSDIREKNVPALTSLLPLPSVLDGHDTLEKGLKKVLQLLERTLFVIREAYDLES